MNKYLKRVIFLMLIVLFVSCTPAKTAVPTEAEQSTAGDMETEPTQAPAEKETVVISFMRPGLGEDALIEVEAQMKPFYEKYPWIKVEPLIVSPPEMAMKLQTAIAGGAPPDIVMAISAGDARKYISNDQLLDLTPYADAEGFDWQNYYSKESLEFYNYNGKLQCINESTDSETLAYNKDMFDAAGLAYPTEDWTWDDLLAAAQELTIDTDGDGVIDQWGFTMPTWDYKPWIWAAGADLYNEDYTEILTDDPVVIDTLQWLADLYFKYEVSPPLEVSSAFPEVGFMFQQGKSAMHMTRWIPDVAFFFADLNFNWDVALMPANPDTGLRASATGGGCTGVFAATEHPDEAYLVWRWLNSDEGVYYRSVANTGQPLPPNGPADQWPMLTEAFSKVEVPANAIAFVEMQPFTRFRDLPFEAGNEVQAAVDANIEELWLGTKTAAEVAPLIKEAVDPLLQQ